jgi:hypothetical protein
MNLNDILSNFHVASLFANPTGSDSQLSGHHFSLIKEADILPSRLLFAAAILI